MPNPATDHLIRESERLRAWLSDTAADISRFAENLAGEARSIREEMSRDDPGQR